MTTKIGCQFTGCAWSIEHDSEAVAIALLTSHSQNHKGASVVATSKQKTPKIDRPEVKQDISDEEWQSFEAEWGRFKKCTEMGNDEIADQLFQCCDRPLKRLLIKENPEIIEEGEEALLEAIKRMAVLHVATSVRRTNLLASKQEHGQTFRQFYANVRAAAATCEFNVKCPYICCNEKKPIDYSPMVIKDILIAGIEDSEIMRDVLGMENLDSKTDKDIVKFVEEKEIARNALNASQSQSGIGALSSYGKSRKNGNAPPADEAVIKKKLAMKGKCATCQKDIALYKKYQNGKLNKEAFKMCIGCHKKTKPATKSNEENDTSEASAVMSFIGTLDLEENSIQMTSSSNSVECIDSLPVENTEFFTIPVKLTLSSRELSKFQKCESDEEFGWTYVIAKGNSTFPECMMGEDMLPKLGCKRAMLIKGRAFVTLEYGGRQVKKMIKVRRNVTGLQLDNLTVNELVEGYLADSSEVDAVDCKPNELCANGSSVVLGHHIFTPNGWVKVSKLSHPTLRLRIHTNASDYSHLGASHPHIAPKFVDVVADSGAQSCLWSRKQFLDSGFSMQDLLPVRHTMRAANRAAIEIDGAILLRLSGESKYGINYEAAAMVYVSPSTNSFFLSKDVMIQLGIIPRSFPQIGSTAQVVPGSINASEMMDKKCTSNANNSSNGQSTPTTAPCGCQ